MAVAINTLFSNLYLSAMLPECVSFSVQDENTSAVVSVYVDHQIVFKTTLYAYGHNMYLNDIRSIIEEGIRQNENAHGECMIVISDEESNASTQNFVVLISDFAIPSPMYFLATHFQLSFLNAFNVTEYAEFYAVTTRKQKVERSEAHCNFDHIFYDQKTEIAFEVETAALPYEEAMWLNQVFSSRYVAIPIYGDTFEQILITDSTSEITDSDKEQNRLKFTYKFAKDKQHKYVDYPPAYFTEEYNEQFM